LESIEARSSAEDLKNQVNSRLLFAMSGDSQQALAPLQSSDSIDQDYWRNLIRAQLDYFAMPEGPSLPARARDIALSLREAAAAIEQRADLRIGPPMFCKQVYNFGNCVEFDEYRFAKGAPVIVYWEVEHFQSVP